MSKQRQNTKAITLTELRKDIYNLADQVIETGQPLVIDRGGVFLAVSPMVPVKRAKAVEKFWEKLKGLGPVIAEGVDLDNLETWDEKAWEEKWDKRLS